MLIDATINQMTVVELRNYINLLHSQENRLRNVIQAQDEMISALLNLYNESSRKSEATITLNANGGNIAKFEHDMEQRYGGDKCAAADPFHTVDDPLRTIDDRTIAQDRREY